jgi:hypothetical protein
MTKLILLLSLVSSSAALASNEKIAAKCLETGIAKITSQAEIWGCTTDLNSVVVTAVDNRLLNPYKYIWYKANVSCQDQAYTEIQKMVQYNSFSGECL